jgi:hypothetical protein
MRILLALLAMITGLSLPEVAFAASRTEIAESGVASAATASAERRQQRCVQRGGAVPQTRTTARRRTVWLPAPAFVRFCGIELTDRARE